MKEVLLLYGATEFGAPHFSGDILWRTGFRAPDPFFLVEVRDRAYLFVSALEFGRAKKEAKADEVILIREGIADILRFLNGKRVKRVSVPSDFPYGLAKTIDKEFEVAVQEPPFYPQRLRKEDGEMREIAAAQSAAARSLRKVISFLGSCRIRGRLVTDGGRAVTSEAVRKMIEDSLREDGYFATSTIVASGLQAADPHAIGNGPLEARSPIVIDIFPVSLRAHYYGDMTRTIFKGEPPKEYIRMYEAVRRVQERAIALVRPGADGKEIYDEVRRCFKAEGYPTRIRAGNAEGFIHGLGHGVGLEIHEPPNLGARSWILEAGNVITVEPGLYYRRARRAATGIIPAGGIRIEDLVAVTKTGCTNLTEFSKSLRDVIL